MIAAATATDSGGDRSSRASKAPKPGPAIGPDGQPRKMTAYELAVSQLPPVCFVWPFFFSLWYFLRHFKIPEKGGF